MESWKKKLFSDEQMMAILESLIESPKSAKQISQECDIPISSVYRKLRILKEKQFLVTQDLLHTNKSEPDGFELNF